jgi:hypothetical protein
MERREAPIMPRFAKRDARRATDALRPTALHAVSYGGRAALSAAFLPSLRLLDPTPFGASG